MDRFTYDEEKRLQVLGCASDYLTFVTGSVKCGTIPFGSIYYSSHIFVGMLYMDMKFGGRGKIAAWDEDPHTATELGHFFKLFALQHSAPFATIVVWCESTQLGMVKEAMLSSGFHSVQSIFWYKKDQQQNMGAHMMVPSVEVGLLAFLTGATQSNQYRHSINLPANPSDRHNIIIGPGQRQYDRTAEGKVINVCQKPAYLSEYFGTRYLQPNSWVYVAGLHECWAQRSRDGERCPPAESNDG